MPDTQMGGCESWTVTRKCSKGKQRRVPCTMPTFEGYIREPRKSGQDGRVTGGSRTHL